VQCDPADPRACIPGVLRISPEGNPTERASRRVIAAALIGVLALGARADGAPSRSSRLQACFVGLNEPHEVEVFRSHLDLDRFELVDVRAPVPAQRTDGSDTTAAAWLLDACVPGVRCDLVVLSGEFAGGFFGRGGSLSLQAMEEASCQERCAGLFRHPREVFLLACNTVATKNQDSVLRRRICAATPPDRRAVSLLNMRPLLSELGRLAPLSRLWFHPPGDQTGR
jgi:hypothetical protein